MCGNCSAHGGQDLAGPLAWASPSWPPLDFDAGGCTTLTLKGSVSPEVGQVSSCDTVGLQESPAVPSYSP